MTGWTGSRRGWLAFAASLAALTLVALGLPLVASLPGADAAATVDFAARKSFNDNVSIVLIGNNLLTCPSSASTCASARHGTGDDLRNNDFSMVNLDADGAAFSTFNSSMSQLGLPANSTVLWAGLYWG